MRFSGQRSLHTGNHLCFLVVLPVLLRCCSCKAVPSPLRVGPLDWDAGS